MKIFQTDEERFKFQLRKMPDKELKEWIENPMLSRYGKSQTLKEFSRRKLKRLS